MKLENEHIKQQTYGVPEGYFESFQDALEARMSEERLKEKVTDSGFKAPEGYFDAFKVLEVTAPAEQSAKVIPLWNRKSWMGVAAAAACLLLVFSIFNRPTEEDQTNLAFEDLSIESIESYLDSGALELTDQDLTALLSDSDIELSEASSEDQISNEVLENYLLENLDTNDLYTQYEE